MTEPAKRGRGRGKAAPEDQTIRRSVKLTPKEYDAWKASGQTLADLVRIGLGTKERIDE